MKYAFDFHNTIERHPEFFKNIMSALNEDNIVIIITGPPLHVVQKELEKLGFEQHEHYSSIKTIVDYLFHENKKMWQDEDGNWWANDEDWNSAKSQICDIHNIDYLIDDSETYGKYFDDNHRTEYIKF